MRKDWREWVLAVQKENESWHTFDAAEKVLYVVMEKGASCIPLGELYTIKRTHGTSLGNTQWVIC